MNEIVIVDAGPLVAYLDRSDQHHEWAVESFLTAKQPAPNLRGRDGRGLASAPAWPDQP
jgi:hypothetical protein